MKYLSIAALALLMTPTFAADMPLMSELNPQPLPPIAPEAEALVPAEETQAITDSRVRITNGTDSEIMELYTSRAGAGNWQTVLAGRTVSPGTAVTVDFANGSGICEFDLRAVFGNGAEQVVQGLDACVAGEVNFSS